MIQQSFAKRKKWVGQRYAKTVILAQIIKIPDNSCACHIENLFCIKAGQNVSTHETVQ